MLDILKNPNSLILRKLKS